MQRADGAGRCKYRWHRDLGIVDGEVVTLNLLRGNKLDANKGGAAARTLCITGGGAAASIKPVRS